MSWAGGGGGGSWPLGDKYLQVCRAAWEPRAEGPAGGMAAVKWLTPEAGIENFQREISPGFRKRIPQMP